MLLNIIVASGAWEKNDELGGTTCLTLLVYCGLVCFIFACRRVKNHHNLLHHSPSLKKTCVRQVVLGKWFPLNEASRNTLS